MVIGNNDDNDNMNDASIICFSGGKTAKSQVLYNYFQPSILTMWQLLSGLQQFWANSRFQVILSPDDFHLEKQTDNFHLGSKN